MQMVRLNALDLDETSTEYLFPGSKQEIGSPEIQRRGAKSKEWALLKYMVNVHKERKLKGLMGSELVNTLDIPMNVLHLIAAPLVWH